MSTMKKISQVEEQRQAIQLSTPDRRLLLSATFRLFLSRLKHGLPVLRDDVVRVAAYADESQRAA